MGDSTQKNPFRKTPPSATEIADAVAIVRDQMLALPMRDKLELARDLCQKLKEDPMFDDFKQVSAIASNTHTLYLASKVADTALAHADKVEGRE